MTATYSSDRPVHQAMADDAPFVRTRILKDLRNDSVALLRQMRFITSNTTAVV